MKPLCFLILISLTAPCFGEGLQTSLDAIAANQGRIASEVARGDLTVRIVDEEGAVLNTIAQSITLYLKRPDKIKIVVTSAEGTSIVITQIKDTLSQKINGGAVTTKKVTPDTDVFQRYLGYGIEHMADYFTVVASRPAAGTTEYELVPNAGRKDLDRYVVRIDNTTGMLVYEAYMNQNIKTLEIEKSYIKKDSVFVLRKMSLRTTQQGMKMETVFDYKTIEANIAIPEKEFELQ
jgi:outer membrane lipoprotein-sorting protein